MSSVVRSLSLWVASLSLVGCQVLTGLSQLEVTSKDSGTSEDGGTSDDGSSPRQLESDAGDTPDSSIEAMADAASEPSERESDCPLKDGAACDLVRQCGCGAGLRCQAMGEEGEPSCAPPPRDPCPRVEDGACDEAKGTGRCAEGSDAKDCSCKPSLPGAACDLVAQCGCARGQTCMPEAAGAICAAARPGTAKVGERCTINDDCRAGLACNYGTCQPFCATDRECPDGHACRDVYTDDGTPVAGVRLCVTSCDRASAASQCEAGTTCVQLDSRFPLPGSFCAVPLQKCEGPIVADLVCDEPEGTGLCADGADPVGCCRITRPNAECDPVQQCGCEAQPGTSCQHVHAADDSFSASCLPHGTVAAEQFCVDDEKCAAGSLCVDHVCRPYCGGQRQCSGGACSKFWSGGLEVTDLGVCMHRCTDDQSCQPQTSCVMDDVSATRACQFQPFAECPYRSDGECDEPGSTGLCAQGSDPEDCSSTI